MSPVAREPRSAPGAWLDTSSGLLGSARHMHHQDRAGLSCSTSWLTLPSSIERTAPSARNVATLQMPRILQTTCGRLPTVRAESAPYGGVERGNQSSVMLRGRIVTNVA
jgi:hypothetical protein